MESIIAAVFISLTVAAGMLFLGFSFAEVLVVCWVTVPVVLLALLIRFAMRKLIRSVRRKLGR
jgi:hypothetical protein